MILYTVQLHLEFDIWEWQFSKAWLLYVWLFPAFYSHYWGQGLYSEHTQLQIFLQLHQIPTAGSTIEGIMRRKSRHLISCPRCLQRCSQHCRRVLFLCWRQFTVKCDVLCNSGNCTLRAGNEVWLSERADAYRPLWLITSACLPNTPCAPLTPPGKPLPEFHMAHSWVIVHATSFPESTWLLEFQWPQQSSSSSSYGN